MEKFVFSKCTDEVWIKMYDNEFMSDIQFKSSDEKETLNAHSFLLGLESEVFNAQFFGYFTEPKDNNSKKIQITVTDLSWQAFTLLIRYLYKCKDELSTISPTIMVDLLNGAKKYLLNDLKTKILDRINHRYIQMSKSHIYYIASFVHEEIDREFHLHNAAFDRETLNDNCLNDTKFEIFSKLINCLIEKESVPIAIIFQSILSWVQYNVPEARKEGINVKELFEIMKSYGFEPYQYIKYFDRIDLEEVIIKKKLYVDEAHLLNMVLHNLSCPRFFSKEYIFNQRKSGELLLNSISSITRDKIFIPSFCPIYLIKFDFDVSENISSIIIELFKEVDDNNTETKMLNWKKNARIYGSRRIVDIPQIPFYPGYICHIILNTNSRIKLTWIQQESIKACFDDNNNQNSQKIYNNNLKISLNYK